MSGRRLLVITGVALFLVILLRNAWISDQAYLSLRTADNAARGLGLRWNPMERVQVFEHPLWMLALTAGRLVTGEVYFSALILSTVCSAAAVAIVLAAATSEGAVLAATLVLTLSSSFVSYSSSGLEGPLAHVLIAAFAVVWLEDRSAGRERRAAMLAGLAAVTQVTTLLVALPAFVMSLARATGRTRRDVLLLALGPLAVWGLWSTWYYGTAMPNPAIARLAAGAPPSAVLGQGWAWLADGLWTDPITAFASAAGIVLPFIRRSPARLLSFGLVLYLAVATATGGDVMSGRWFGVPLVVAAIIIVRDERWEHGTFALPALASALLLAAVSPRPVLGSHAMFGAAPTSTPELSPYDARAFDYAATGLLRFVRQSRFPDWPGGNRAYEAWANPDRVLVAFDHPGFTGYAAGYGVYVIDPSAQGDPLLARLRPPLGRDGDPAPSGSIWERRRPIPDGYVRSLPDKANSLADSGLSAYYDQVRLVTRGPLGSWGRPLAAVRLCLSAPPAPPWTR
jgi:arabinofuranosyltransferase